MRRGAGVRREAPSRSVSGVFVFLCLRAPPVEGTGGTSCAAQVGRLCGGQGLPAGGSRGLHVFVAGPAEVVCRHRR